MLKSQPSSIAQQLPQGLGYTQDARSSKALSTEIHQCRTLKPSPEFHFVILFNVIIVCIQFISHDNIK